MLSKLCLVIRETVLHIYGYTEYLGSSWSASEIEAFLEHLTYITLVYNIVTK